MSPNDYAVVEDAIRYLEANFREQPSLSELAEHCELSPTHLQRVFKRWAGVSPKRFLQFLTLEYAKQRLRESSVLGASYDAGLSGPSRLHDLFVNVEAVTPGEFKRRGGGLEIRWGVHPSVFGECLIGTTPRGICWLAFVGEKDAREALAELEHQWRGATLREDRAGTAQVAGEVLAGPVQWDARSSRFRLLLRGTNFQLQVWRALLRIPPGELVTYSQLAEAVGRPSAVRAVGGAVGANPISYLVPCHRVIRKSGKFEGYRWGVARKSAILGWEAAQRVNTEPEGSRALARSPSAPEDLSS